MDTQIENEVLKTLLRQGQIKKSAKSESDFYLTDEGITIAKGTLRLFPELEAQRRKKQ